MSASRVESDLKINVMDPLTFPRTMAVLDQAVEEKAAPSISIGVWSHETPNEVYIGGLGAGVSAHSVFDLASVTKVIGTMAAVAALIERRLLTWDTQVQSILPEYPDREGRLIHLVSHTAGWVWWQPFWESVRAKYSPIAIESIPFVTRQKDYLDLLKKLKPEHKVGENCTYSDISMMWVGFLIERITGLELDHFLERDVWPWIGIETAYFNRIIQTGMTDATVIPTEDCPWRGRRLQGVVHDDNCYVMGGVAAHAGVFSEITAPLWYGKKILSGFFSHAVTEGFFNRVSLPEGCPRTGGWDTPSGPTPSLGRYFSDRSIGHLGFTGTSLWLDPEHGIAVSLLSNRVYYGRENEKLKIFRPLIHDELALDLKASRLMA